MGLDYSYDLLFSRQKLKDVLLAIAAIASPKGETPLEVVFTDETLKLPFTSRFKSEPVICETPLQSLSFDTSLFFSQDEPLRRYEEESRSTNYPVLVDKEGRVAFGYIYLSVIPCSYNNEECVSFSFEPATSRMSLIFAASQSIRETFTRLLELYEGRLGMFVDSDCNWGPIIIWPESSPHYNPENLLVLHNTLSPDTPYYRSHSRRLT